MKEKLLIVDDSVTIQKIVAMAFENENMIVQGASNGKEALEKLKDFHPDIIITDVDMPGIDGFEVSRKIREQETFKSVPILLLTSGFEEFNETLFKRSMASDHLSKPFKSEKIVEKVHELLDSSTEGSTELLDDTQSIKEPSSEATQDSNENTEAIETVADIQNSSSPSSSKNQLEEGSSEEILENLKQETEKNTNIIEPEGIKSQPASGPEETNASSTTIKAEDMTIEELLLSAEALLEENYIDSEDKQSEFAQSSQTNADKNQISEVPEPVLSEEENNPESATVDAGESRENESNLEDVPPTFETTDIPQDEKTSLQTDSANSQKENLTFEESLESELKQPSEDPVLKETNLRESLEESTKQIEASDLDDSFLHSHISESDVAIDNDPIVESESTPPQVHTKWLADETTTPKIEEESVSKDNLVEITNEDQDDHRSQETIDELDTVFESIQNFENHITNVEPTETNNIEVPPSEPSSAQTPAIDIEEPTEEEAIPIPQKVEDEQIFEEEPSSQKPTFASEFSDYNISPEPDNLLEKLAPSAFDTPGTEGRPDLIQESLAYLSELTPEPSKTKPKEKTKPAPSEKKEIHMNSEPIGDMFVKVVGEHVKRILERSLEETIAREISGLSKTIERSVKEVVKEVTPEITRSIIQEEIEKIRKLEEV